MASLMWSSTFLFGVRQITITIVLPHVVSEIFNVEKYRVLEIRVRGHSRSLKVVPFHRLGMVSYYCSIVTLSLR